MRVGSVLLLRRFPLRSAGGELPAAALLGPDGLDGDRRWSLVAAGGAVLTARDVPALGGLRARLDVTGGLTVLVGGRWLAGGALQEALSALVGAPVAVQDSAQDSAQDPARGASPSSPRGVRAGPHREGAAVHLVSEGAAAAPGADPGCDPGLRANAVLALDPAVAAAGAERGWGGRRLAVGAAQLLLTATPRRCLGVYAEVAVPGPVRVGDEAVLLEGPGTVGRPG